MYTPNKIIATIDDSNIPALVGGKGDGSPEKEKYDPLQWLKNGMVSMTDSYCKLFQW